MRVGGHRPPERVEGRADGVHSRPLARVRLDAPLARHVLVVPLLPAPGPGPTPATRPRAATTSAGIDVVAVLTRGGRRRPRAPARRDGAVAGRRGGHGQGRARRRGRRHVPDDGLDAEPRRRFGDGRRRCPAGWWNGPGASWTAGDHGYRGRRSGHPRLDQRQGLLLGGGGRRARRGRGQARRARRGGGGHAPRPKRREGRGWAPAFRRRWQDRRRPLLGLRELRVLALGGDGRDAHLHRVLAHVRRRVQVIVVLHIERDAVLLRRTQ